MNSLLLWSVARLAPVWARLGADPRALRIILETKLKVGDRTLKMPGRTQDKPTDFSGLIYFFLFLFGILLAVVYTASDDPATGIGLIFTATSIYLAFMLVLEMADSLFDRRDLTLLYSRPVTGATLSLSRGLYIFLFASKFVVPLLLPATFAVAYRQVWMLPVYLALAVILTVTVVGLTLGVYLTLLRRMPPDNLQRNLQYAQIVFTTLIILIYQLPNLLNLSGGGSWLFELHLPGTAWGFAGPGLWLAGLWDSLVHPGARPLSILQGLLGIGVAGWSVRFFVRQGSDYGAQMMNMQIGGSAAAVPETTAHGPGRLAAYRDALASWFTRPGPERGSFRFNWAMMGRDFGFKQQVYPLLILLVVGAVVLTVRILRTPGAAALGAGTILTVLYVFSFFMVTPLLAARQTDSFRAAWVWYTNPVGGPNRLLYGQLIAALGQIFLPAALLIFTAMLLWEGISIVDDLALNGAVTLIVAVVFQLSQRSLPFSVEKKSGNFSAFGPMVLAGLMGATTGILHYGLTFLPYGVVTGAVLMWIVCLASFRVLRR